MLELKITMWVLSFIILWGFGKDIEDGNVNDKSAEPYLAFALFGSVHAVVSGISFVFGG